MGSSESLVAPSAEESGVSDSSNISAPTQESIDEMWRDMSTRAVFVRVTSTFLTVCAVVLVAYLIYEVYNFGECFILEGIDAIARWDEGEQIGLGPGHEIVLSEGMNDAIKRENDGSQIGIVSDTLLGRIRRYY